MRLVATIAALAEAQQLTRKIAGEIHLTMGQFAAHRRASPTTVVSEHDATMNAIRTSDVEGAQVALAEHLSRE